jgi:small subunit ribosomal protein S16
MTKIRLARVGSTHQPYYRIVVADSRNPRDGRFLEILGSYNPHTHPSTVVLNAERALYWVSVGAQASNTTISLLSRAGVDHPFQVRKKPFKKQEASAEAVAADASEAVAAEPENTTEAPINEDTKETPQE